MIGVGRVFKRRVTLDYLNNHSVGCLAFNLKSIKNGTNLALA